MTLWLIPFFPLIGFLINGLFGRRLSKAVINVIAVGSVGASFLCVVLALLFKLYPLSAHVHRTLLHLDSERLSPNRLRPFQWTG